EPGRSDADDPRPLLRIRHDQRASEHRQAAAELALPRPIAEYDDWCGARQSIIRQEQAADRGAHSEHVEVVRRRRHRTELHGYALVEERNRLDAQVIDARDA